MEKKIVFSPITVIAAMFLIIPGVSMSQELAIQQLKAGDVERLLTYESLKYSQNTPGGLTSSSQCLLEDTDGDGMPDSWELEHGLDPLNPDDAWFDPDGDGVVNLFEYQLGSDPHDPTTPPVVTVAPSGADFTDVRQAIDAVAPGTLIQVAGGTYQVNYTTFNEKVVMIQGGWSEDFTERDLRQFPTTFDGRMQSEILYFSNNAGDPVIVLDGIHFIGARGNFGAINLLAQGSACMKTSIVNCTIMQSTSSFSFGGVLNMNSWDSSESDRTVANTMIVGNPSSGIYSQITQDGLSRWRVIHTTISDNTNGGGSNGYGIDAFTLGAAGLSAHIYNSIVWGNAAADVQIGRNIVFEVDHSDIDRVRTDGADFRKGPGMLNVDPAFVDPAGGDYHLQQTSPLREAGTPRGIPLTDFEGDPRPRNVGGAPDIGADEIVDDPS